MSKFLFLLAAGMAFSPASGFNFFRCHACNYTDYFDCVEDICEEAMYGYYKNTPTLDDRYVELEVIYHSDSINIAAYNTCENEIAIDFCDISPQQQVPVMPQTPVMSSIEVICPKPIYAYFFESETEDYKLDGFDSNGNSLHSSRCDEE